MTDTKNVGAPGRQTTPQELIKSSIEACGGLARWKMVRQISFDFTPWGPGLVARGPAGAATIHKMSRVTVDTNEQKVTAEPFVAPGQRAVYEPHRTAIESSGGALIEELKNPRESLTHMPAGTPWSASQLIYFIGYSLWMYHSLPFSFLKEGIEAEEIEPWVEDGETWRALKITYPESFPSHSREQIHYFDAKGLMRRQDYSVDVRQELKAAHYIHEYQKFDGFMFPTKRRIYLRGPDGAPLRDKMVISADLEDFKVSRA